ncbi:hypothetical protein KIV40_20435 [Vibrio sp. D173a]|uniref:hypothetical protein n=1 Tax=Vibrio sp. D173a TaxID=2836349 RepID=UPI002556139C|nr:hypothetical protein [Vibrio sp. D173a]MDK9757698.1 hypothetical protein [Vibrio sp. D173a]
MITRPLLTLDVGIYASPDYLQKYGEPKSIETLSHHKCLPVRSLTTGRFRYWRINEGATQSSMSLVFI